MPDRSPSSISWIGSIQIWLTMVGGIFTGRLLDAGFFVPTLLIGAILQVLGMFLMSICTEYWQLMLTQGLLTGIGGGIFFTPALALVATYFDKRRGLAIGLVTTGNSVGGMVYPVVVRQLMPSVGALKFIISWTRWKLTAHLLCNSSWVLPGHVVSWPSSTSLLSQYVRC